MIDIDVPKERALKAPEIKAEYDLAVLLRAITPENVHEDIELNAIADARKDEPVIRVELDDL